MTRRDLGWRAMLAGAAVADVVRGIDRTADQLRAAGATVAATVSSVALSSRQSSTRLPSSPPRALMSPMMTFAPAAASASAVARPIPDAPPVTSYFVSGLPTGLSFSSVTGLISGTPLASGTFAVTLVAKNSAGESLPVILTLTIAPNITFNF